MSQAWPATDIPLLLRQWVPALSLERRWKRRWLANAAACGVRRHLLLYSRDDRIIAASAVHDFACALRAASTAAESSSSSSSREQACVEEVVWEESKHVQHLRHHPEECVPPLLPPAFSAAF